ncbi:MAG: hypothetical protein PHE58_05570, partial [Candidatus Omnitrophica bacterium]|nr:hypothetical protein [Candidatus Omnitrophota bacterium]
EECLSEHDLTRYKQLLEYLSPGKFQYKNLPFADREIGGIFAAYSSREISVKRLARMLGLQESTSADMQKVHKLLGRMLKSGLFVRKGRDMYELQPGIARLVGWYIEEDPSAHDFADKLGITTVRKNYSVKHDKMKARLFQVSAAMRKAQFDRKKAIQILSKERGRSIAKPTFNGWIQELTNPESRYFDPDFASEMSLYEISSQDVQEAMEKEDFDGRKALKYLTDHGKKKIKPANIYTVIYRLTTPGTAQYDENFTREYNKRKLTVDEVKSAFEISGYDPHKGFEILQSQYGKIITYEAVYAWVKKLTNGQSKYHDPEFALKYHEAAGHRKLRAHPTVRVVRKPRERNKQPRIISSTAKSIPQPRNVPEDQEQPEIVSSPVAIQALPEVVDEKLVKLFAEQLDEKINYYLRNNSFSTAIHYLDSLRILHNANQQFQTVMMEKEVCIWNAVWFANDIKFTRDHIVGLSYSLPFILQERFKSLQLGPVMLHPFGDLFVRYRIPATAENLRIILDLIPGITATEVRSEFDSLNRYLRDEMAKNPAGGFINPGKLTLSVDNESFRRVRKAMGRFSDNDGGIEEYPSAWGLGEYRESYWERPVYRGEDTVEDDVYDRYGLLIGEDNFYDLEETYGERLGELLEEGALVESLDEVINVFERLYPLARFEWAPDVYGRPELLIAKEAMRYGIKCERDNFGDSLRTFDLMCREFLYSGMSCKEVFFHNKTRRLGGFVYTIYDPETKIAARISIRKEGIGYIEKFGRMKKDTFNEKIKTLELIRIRSGNIQRTGFTVMSSVRYSDWQYMHYGISGMVKSGQSIAPRDLYEQDKNAWLSLLSQAYPYARDMEFPRYTITEADLKTIQIVDNARTLLGLANYYSLNPGAIAYAFYTRFQRKHKFNGGMQNIFYYHSLMYDAERAWQIIQKEEREHLYQFSEDGVPEEKLWELFLERLVISRFTVTKSIREAREKRDWLWKNFLPVCSFCMDADREYLKERAAFLRENKIFLSHVTLQDYSIEYLKTLVGIWKMLGIEPNSYNISILSKLEDLLYLIVQLAEKGYPIHTYYLRPGIDFNKIVDEIEEEREYEFTESNRFENIALKAKPFPSALTKEEISAALWNADIFHVFGFGHPDAIASTDDHNVSAVEVKQWSPGHFQAFYNLIELLDSIKDHQTDFEDGFDALVEQNMPKLRFILERHGKHPQESHMFQIRRHCRTMRVLEQSNRLWRFNGNIILKVVPESVEAAGKVADYLNEHAALVGWGFKRIKVVPVEKNDENDGGGDDSLWKIKCAVDARRLGMSVSEDLELFFETWKFFAAHNSLFTGKELFEARRLHADERLIREFLKQKITGFTAEDVFSEDESIVAFFTVNNRKIMVRIAPDSFVDYLTDTSKLHSFFGKGIRVDILLDPEEIDLIIRDLKFYRAHPEFYRYVYDLNSEEHGKVMGAITSLSLLLDDPVFASEARRLLHAALFISDPEAQRKAQEILVNLNRGRPLVFPAAGDVRVAVLDENIPFEDIRLEVGFDPIEDTEALGGFHARLAV